MISLAVKFAKFECISCFNTGIDRLVTAREWLHVQLSPIRIVLRKISLAVYPAKQTKSPPKRALKRCEIGSVLKAR